MNTDFSRLIQSSLEEGIELRRATLALMPEIEAAGQIIIRALAAGCKVFFAGNGGSAADAQHLAAELVGRFETDNCLPGIALTTDTSILTSIGNDFGFDGIYSRQLKALGRPGDCLVALSTSGNSPNIVLAIEQAQKLGIEVVAMTGQGGGRMAEQVPGCLRIPSRRTCRVQEIHISIGHIWCEMVEEARRRGQIPPL